MAVDDSHRLQKRIEDGRSNKGHSSFFQILGNSVGQREGGSFSKLFHDNVIIGKGPYVITERTVFLLNRFIHNAVMSTPIAEAHKAFYHRIEGGPILHQGTSHRVHYLD